MILKQNTSFFYVHFYYNFFALKNKLEEIKAIWKIFLKKFTVRTHSTFADFSRPYKKYMMYFKHWNNKMVVLAAQFDHFVATYYVYFK